MSTKFLVKISNTIGIIAILLLIYWLFSFILASVFSLDVFRELLIDTFVTSVLGILALLVGALMLNIMINLTRIAEKKPEQAVSNKQKKILWILLAIFPLIALLLFIGDYLSVEQQRKYLIKSAETIIEDHPKQMSVFANYKFTPDDLKHSHEALDILRRVNSEFTKIKLIVPDHIDGTNVYLSFDIKGLESLKGLIEQEKINPPINTTDKPATSSSQDLVMINIPSANDNVEQKQLLFKKTDFINQSELKEREYLNKVFNEQHTQTQFHIKNTIYKIYYPYQSNGKTKFVLYFSNYDS